VPVVELDHFPQGGGAHHWIAAAADGSRWFVTCDDLDTKAWLGEDRDSVFAGLGDAYRAAAELRWSGGLSFVVAPVATPAGEIAVRLGSRYSLALLPFVEGTPGRWGERIAAGERARWLALLAELHASTSAARSAPRRPVGIPGRRHLEEALDDLDRPWQGGPFSEAAREQLAHHADTVSGWLDSFDEMACRLARSDSPLVVTHGEPHPGNLIRTGGGLALIDWDTVAVDRPERDLWMLDDGRGSVCADYEALAGRSVDADAWVVYRMAWTLIDLAAFTAVLRNRHDDDADSRKARSGVTGILALEEPSPYGRRLP
jgi:spectinomycin phosphotransferase